MHSVQGQVRVCVVTTAETMSHTAAIFDVPQCLTLRVWSDD